jgi:hypothetical protein
MVRAGGTPAGSERVTRRSARSREVNFQVKVVIELKRFLRID